MDQDSPLSVTANVAGILTFVVAIVAAVYVRFTYLRNSDEEYFRVKTSLSWYKTESAWLAELVKAAGERPGVQFRPEYQMYKFVMDDLINLEKRLLELVEEVEMIVTSEETRRTGESWTLIPTGWSFTTAVAVAWLPRRTKAFELVRQRDALTARVSFTQMSMISSRIQNLEQGNRFQGDKTKDSLEKFGDIIEDQKAEIRRLEDLVYRVMHRTRVGPEANTERTFRVNDVGMPSTRSDSQRVSNSSSEPSTFSLDVHDSEDERGSTITTWRDKL
ncbi:hypothetical protein JX265_009156 [Neoarthrinium moseri]|uniref:Uncharacterized protein n=1 Tax=Neoarthrinium moseri TaxID=1658444 RepID=A0A9Q0AMU4_9PEZI|nr:hypothetical protein JX265_009156 [Neoarthrinium moseri]